MLLQFVIKTERLIMGFLKTNNITCNILMYVRFIICIDLCTMCHCPVVYMSVSVYHMISSRVNKLQFSFVNSLSLKTLY